MLFQNVLPWILICFCIVYFVHRTINLFWIWIWIPSIIKLIDAGYVLTSGPSDCTMTTTKSDENGEISSQSQGQSLPWEDLVGLPSQPDPLADLIIDVEGHQLYTSKYMLANVSSKFRQMFTAAAAENPNILTLPGTSLRAAVDLLRWLLPSETLTISGRMGLYLDIRFFIFHTLLWRHDGRGGVSNHQPHDCLLNCLFRRRSKKTSKLRVSGLCAWNRWAVNSLHKWPVTRKMFPFDTVIHQSFWKRHLINDR